MRYFVSYYGKTRFGGSKVGSCITESNKPIDSGDAFDDLAESIRKDSKLKKVVVLNIKELKI